VGRLGFRVGVSASYCYFRRVANFCDRHTAAMWLRPAYNFCRHLRNAFQKYYIAQNQWQWQAGAKGGMHPGRHFSRDYISWKTKNFRHVYTPLNALQLSISHQRCSVTFQPIGTLESSPHSLVG